MNKLCKHLNQIRRYGIATELVTIYQHIIRHDYWDYELRIERQKYYENLPKSKYEIELKNWYYQETGHTLDLEKPRRFTEKIQWMKLYGFGDKETMLVDKYKVREWVKQTIGEEYLIPLYGVWDNPNNIDFDLLPKPCILKGNHGSQMSIIIRENSSIDKSAVIKTLEKWLEVDFAHCLGGFELQYENVPRRIIAEKLMIDNDTGELNDYKFHCFNGVPKFCELICNRSTKETIDYFDMNWEHQNFIDESADSQIKNSPTIPIKPDLFEEMKILAQKLSEGFPYVRVDLYIINNRVFFGEMTFTPASGADIFTPDSADYMLGDLFTLPHTTSKDN